MRARGQFSLKARGASDGVVHVGEVRSRLLLCGLRPLACLSPRGIVEGRCFFFALTNERAAYKNQIKNQIAIMIIWATAALVQRSLVTRWLHTHAPREDRVAFSLRRPD